MALMKCRDCGKEMSNHASRCPHCGRNYTPRLSQEELMGIAIFMVFFMLLMLWIGYGS